MTNNAITISGLQTLNNLGQTQFGDIIPCNRGTGINASGCATFAPKLSMDTIPTLAGSLRMNGFNIFPTTGITITPTEVSYLDGLTGNIQGQINAIIAGSGFTNLVAPNTNIAIAAINNAAGTYDSWISIQPGIIAASDVTFSMNSNVTSNPNLVFSLKGSASSGSIDVKAAALPNSRIRLTPDSSTFDFLSYRNRNLGNWIFRTSNNGFGTCVIQLTDVSGTINFPSVAGTLALTTDVSTSITNNNSSFVTPSINSAITTNNTTTAPTRARCWGSFTASTGALLTNNGITSVSRSGAGNYTVTMTNALSGSSYAVCVGGYLAGASFTLDGFVANKTTTTFDIKTNSTVNGTTATDGSVFIDFVVFSN